jgi:hypothetical protein
LHGVNIINKIDIKYLITLKNPRLCVLAAVHPQNLFKLLKSEKDMDESSDGFISRFCVFTPEPSRLSLRK